MMEDSILSQGIHHVAFATRNSKATYEFYNNKLGMPLTHVEIHRQEEGYFKHYFFDMGQDQYMGFFEVSNVGEKPDFRTDISTGLGLPPWVNHVAFNIGNRECFEEIKSRLKIYKVKMMAEVDHEWCRSVYLLDPNKIMVEFTYTSDISKFSQTPEEAYDLLFNRGVESAGDETRKDVVTRNP